MLWSCKFFVWWEIVSRCHRIPWFGHPICRSHRVLPHPQTGWIREWGGTILLHLNPFTLLQTVATHFQGHANGLTTVCSRFWLLQARMNLGYYSDTSVESPHPWTGSTIHGQGGSTMLLPFMNPWMGPVKNMQIKFASLRGSGLSRGSNLIASIRNVSGVK